MRIGITVTPSRPASRVSGLTIYQTRIASYLREHGAEIVEAPVPAGGDLRGDRQFFMEAEAVQAGLPFLPASRKCVDDYLSRLDAARLDGLHIVEWMPEGMAVLQAVLESDRPASFVPTEHGALCHYGFGLHNSGQICSGSDQGAKCSPCTSGQEPRGGRSSLLEPWYSTRHRLFAVLGAPFPGAFGSAVTATLARHFPTGNGWLSPREASARHASACRFLHQVGAVAFQSPGQQRWFERVAGESFPTPLPCVMPLLDPIVGGEKSVSARGGPVRFLFAARPDYDRGLWLLLRAWRRWNPRAGTAELNIVTHGLFGEQRRAVEALRSSGCAVKVSMKVLRREELEGLHRETHFVVNPAVWYEPGSATVLEGLFHGTPAIVPTESGSADFVRDGVSGLHYTFRDDRALATCLEQAVSAIERWPSLVSGALEAARAYRALSGRHLDELFAYYRRGGKP